MRNKIFQIWFQIEQPFAEPIIRTPEDEENVAETRVNDFERQSSAVHVIEISRVKLWDIFVF